MERSLTRRVLPFALAIAGGFGSALLYDLSTPEPPVALAKAPAGHHVNVLEVRRGDQAEIDLRDPRPTMRVHLTSQLPEPARLKYAVELTDDLGNEVRPHFESEVVHIAAHGEATVDVDLPRRMRRGYYLLRLTAVARAGAELADHGIEIPFAVLDGKAYPLSDQDWLTYSAANFGD